MTTAPTLFALLLFFSLPILAEPTQASRDASEAKRAILEMVQTPKEPAGLIQLPLRVYLISNLTMNREGEEMEVWVKPADFEKKLLPEINRIWKQANVEWVLESIRIQPAPELPKREKLIESIVNATRDHSPQRVPNILRLCNVSRAHPVVNNLYLFPYVGQTQQGFASLGGNRAVVGVWTDKPFQAKKPPIKFPLAEKGRFKIGSIARTCSHELGHNLALSHPDKATQTEFNRLMGGKKHGYDFIPEEVELARKTAFKRAASIRQWAQK
ncbi:MAG: hypothetical protein ACSHYB_15450 [Roseibacillus sp.]